MKSRLDPYRVAPGIYPLMKSLQDYVEKSGLGSALIHLVYLRVSQLNGCAFCLNMHTLDARKAGEKEERLHLLAVWREVDIYSPKERAALAWAEAVTLVAQKHVSDEIFGEARAQFSEAELAELTLAIVTINGWNRIAISFHVPPILEGK